MDVLFSVLSLMWIKKVTEGLKFDQFVSGYFLIPPSPFTNAPNRYLNRPGYYEDVPNVGKSSKALGEARRN